MVLWLVDESTAQTATVRVEQFLEDTLKLTINPNNTTLQPTNRKLRYLGVELWPKDRRLNAQMRSIIKKRLSENNYESYDAVLCNHGTKRDITKLRHDMLDKLNNLS